VIATPRLNPDTLSTFLGPGLIATSWRHAVSGENVALGHRWFEEVWNKKRLDAIDEMADPAVVGQGAQFHDGLFNREEFRAFAAHLQSAFPDLHLRIEDTIAENDRVVLRWQVHMTHTGQFLQYPATNKKVNIAGITILQVENGKIIAGWDKWDQLGLLEQIGAVPVQVPKPDRAA
jgi:steroid delta-isomerase-like uncharacterized protein